MPLSAIYSKLFLLSAKRWKKQKAARSHQSGELATSARSRPQPDYVRLTSKVSYLMTFENYKIVLYRQEDGSWVAEIPAISGCYALMPTREQALEELSGVFQMVAEEYKEKGLTLPSDTTEIMHA
jgi:predicted RNase H-like HicB family nuclease